MMRVPFPATGDRIDTNFMGKTQRSVLAGTVIAWFIEVLGTASWP